MIELTTRQITLTIAFPIVIFLFILLGIIVLRKDSRYWGNRFFASFFWATALTLAFNLLYLYSTDISYVSSMNLVTAEMAIVGIMGLLLGILVVNKGENTIIHNIKTYLLLGLFATLIVIQVILPGAVYIVVTVVDSVVVLDPQWALNMVLYELAFSQSLIFAIYYFSFKFYKELTPELKTKFRRYLIGLAFLDLTFISVAIDNWGIFGAAYADIGGVLNFCVVIGAILIYLGIVRK